jgi:hypothetical protein
LANLIITIISIALVAVVAAMGLFYGGAAYENAQFGAVAAAIISESNQILTAQRMYAVNHGQADATGVSFTDLVTDGELSSYPPIGGGQLGVTLATGIGYEDSDAGSCYNYNGYQGDFMREPFTYHSGNYILYVFQSNNPYTAPCTTISGRFTDNPKSSIMQLIQAIDKQLSIPSSITEFDGIALPITDNSLSSASAFWVPGNGGNDAVYIRLDNNGDPITNMCYYLYNVNVAGDSYGIICVFGPS